MSFFALPRAENVSAEIFSNSGTISKFNRMSARAGFGSCRVRLVRHGFALDHDPDDSEPRRFKQLVNDPTYFETWIEIALSDLEKARQLGISVITKDDLRDALRRARGGEPAQQIFEEGVNDRAGSGQLKPQS